MLVFVDLSSDQNETNRHLFFFKVPLGTDLSHSELFMVQELYHTDHPLLIRQIHPIVASI